MATQPTPELYEKVRDINRARARTWMGGAMSLAPGLKAAREGKDVHKAVQRFMPQPGERMTTEKNLALVQAKKDITDALAGFINKQQATGAALRGKMGNKDALFKEVMSLAGKAFGAKTSAIAQTVSSYNTQIQKGASDYSRAVTDTMGNVGPENAGLVRRSFEQITEGLGPGGLESPNFATNFRNALIQLEGEGMGGSADAAALAAMVAMRAQADGIDITKVLGASPHEEGRQAFDLLQDIGGNYEQIASEALPLIETSFAAATEALKIADPDMKAAADFAVELMNRLGEGAKPEDVQAIFEDAVRSLPQADASGRPIEAYADLLDQLDDDTLRPGNTLWEARERLFDDPSFKLWMQQNGFQDPRQALKEMRRLFGEERHRRKQADRQKRRERRLGGVGPETGPEMGESRAAKLANDTKAPSPEAAKGAEATYVRDESNKLWMFEGGELRPASDEERAFVKEQVEAKTAEGGDPDAAFDALVAPASRFVELQEMSQQRAEGETAEADFQRRAAAAEPPEVGRGVGGHLSEAGFGITHPGRTLRKLGESHREAYQRRLKKYQERQIRPRGPFETVDDPTRGIGTKLG